MSNIQRISQHESSLQALDQLVQKTERLEDNGSRRFQAMLEERIGDGDQGPVTRGLEEIGRLETGANQLVLDMATGRDVNIHNTMIEMEKAEIAFKLAVQVRNRALQAYEELMRVQI